jgi:hypothetical protein
MKGSWKRLLFTTLAGAVKLKAVGLKVRKGWIILG